MPSITFTVPPNAAGFSLDDIMLLGLQPGDKLHIKGLQNLINGRDVREPNLSRMELSHLHLIWARNTDSAEEVLGALRPRVGLTGFGLSGYAGMNIPNWMTDISILGGLVDVKLMKCINCTQLPPLGKLRFLTTLYLSQMTNVMYIDDSPYEVSAENAFPSLTKMTLYDLPNLKRVLRVEGVEMLSQLSKLSIQKIPIFELPSLPSVKEVDANDASVLLTNIAGKMPNLTELKIKGFHEITELPNELCSLRSLQKLYISCCPNLESIPNMSLSSLQVLSFTHCNSLTSLTQSTTTLNRLRRLQIHYCPKLILPAYMQRLTSLCEVTIMGGDNMIKLYNGLANIPSLKNLSLTDFPSLESLPDWLGDTLTLEKLKISKFPMLASLPDWLGDTLTLQELEISNFPMLASLPDNFDELKNLQKLSIDGCPKLKEPLESRTSEDWYKIDHVRTFESDFVDPINDDRDPNSTDPMDVDEL